MPAPRIRFAAMRGGTVADEYDVMFASAREHMVQRYLATDRAIVTRGAIRATPLGAGLVPRRV
jgi:dihydrodipicolinate reductase